MSRVAKNPVAVPKGVEIALAAGEVSIKGPMGTLIQSLSNDVSVVREGDSLLCKAQNESMQADAMSGTIRALLANMVLGVSKGFERKLTLVGVGYRAQVQGSKLTMQIGFSHPIEFPLPKGITATVEANTKILIKGADKEMVGQIAANLRKIKPPEPYKGKGIRYMGEKITLKQGKTAGGAGGGK